MKLRITILACVLGLLTGLAAAQDLSMEGHANATLQTVKDANGQSTALQVSTGGVSSSGTFAVTGAFTQTGALTCDDINATSTLTIDALDDLTMTVTSSAAGEDLLLVQSGGNDSSISIGAAGTGTDAIKLNATGGSIDVDSADDIAVNATDDIAIAATDDLTLNGGSAGSVVAIGTNTHGNVINIGTDNTAKDTVNVGSVLDDVFIGQNAGGLEAGSGNVASERCIGAICQTVMTLTAVPITGITDGGGGTSAAWGSVKLYDFPEGYIYMQGAVFDGAITGDGVTISATWTGDIGFGTAANANNAHAGTDIDLVPSTGTTLAVANVGAADCVSTATEHAIFDGSATAKDLYLNMLVDDADFTDTATNGTATVTGTLTVTWLNLGDNG